MSQDEVPVAEFRRAWLTVAALLFLDPVAVFGALIRPGAANMFSQRGR